MARRARYAVAASGAHEDPAFDGQAIEEWAHWRRLHPPRAGTQVRWANQRRPPKDDQREWCVYTTRDTSQWARVAQEWFTPPFLVPIDHVAPVGDTSPEPDLMQCSLSPASGAPLTHQHYTNIHRMVRLANCHPLVVRWDKHKERKELDDSKFDKYGRCIKFHQSPFDLHLHLGSRVSMLVGCSVNGARRSGAHRGLLSLWWSPGPKCRLTEEQEDLARAVFFDVVEAAHEVPRMYNNDYTAAAHNLNVRHGVAGLAAISRAGPVLATAYAAHATTTAAGFAAASGRSASAFPAGSSAAGAAGRSTAGARYSGAAPSDPVAAPAQLALAGHAAATRAPPPPQWPAPSPTQLNLAGHASATRAPGAVPKPPAPQLPVPALAFGIAPHAAPLVPASGGHASVPAAPAVVPCPVTTTPPGGPPGRFSQTALPPAFLPSWDFPQFPVARAASGASSPAAAGLPPSLAPVAVPPRAFALPGGTAPPAAPGETAAAAPRGLPPPACVAPPSAPAAPPAATLADVAAEAAILSARLSGALAGPPAGVAATSAWPHPAAAAAGIAPPAADAGEEEDPAQDSGPDAEDDEPAEPREHAVRRTRPRSSSPPRPRDPAGAAPALWAGGDEEEDADLRTRLSKAQIAELSDARKAELRQIVKEEPPQHHFSDNKVAWRAAALAASGEEWSLGPHWERNAELMQRALDAYCEPIPEPQAFLLGIAHRNSKEEYAGELWNVPRALASKKVHYGTRLERAMFLSNGNAASGAAFHEAYPNGVLDNGFTALTARAYMAHKAAAKIPCDARYVQHLLNKHDGEVRHWGARWWTRVPEDFVDSLSSERFWHYQFTKSSQARHHLYARGTGRLTTQEIDHILTLEGGETTLLKRVRDPASGGTRETWYFRAGQHVTLAELFNYGCHLCSCHFLYTLYLKQTIFVTRKRHSECTSVKRNARSLHHLETGRYGLPWESW